MTQPQVGWWTTICCALDLRQIEDEADLRDCLETAEEVGCEFWPTKDDALRDLRARNAPGMELWSDDEGSGVK